MRPAVLVKIRTSRAGSRAQLSVRGFAVNYIVTNLSRTSALPRVVSKTRLRHDATQFIVAVGGRAAERVGQVIPAKPEMI